MSKFEQPAFPTYEWNHLNKKFDVTRDGMTLRDYFAAKALQGRITQRLWSRVYNDDDYSHRTHWQYLLRPLKPEDKQDE